MSGMERREFVALLSGAAVAWPLTARAQQSARVWRIGFWRRYPRRRYPNFDALRNGLRELGYDAGSKPLLTG